MHQELTLTIIHIFSQPLRYFLSCNQSWLTVITKHEPIKRTIQLEVVEGALLAADSTGITGWTQDVCRRGWVGEGRRGAPQSRGQQALEPPSSYEQVFQITKHVTQRVLSL